MRVAEFERPRRLGEPRAAKIESGEISCEAPLRENGIARIIVRREGCGGKEIRRTGETGERKRKSKDNAEALRAQRFAETMRD